MNLARKRLLRALGYALAALLGLLLCGWHFLIWHTLEIDPAAMAGVPTCTATADSLHLGSINRCRKIVLSLLQLRRIPGLTIAVSQNGKLIWSEGFGWADAQKRIPACPPHQFRLASVSKLLTAAAMAKLVERGQLDLDGDVRSYVPEFPDKGGRITPRQLASHRSGIRHYRDDLEASAEKHYAGVIASLDQFKDDALLFKPGTASRYSSYGYVLLSAAIERAAGKDFLAFMQEEIFTPLQMHATAPAGPCNTCPLQTKFYDHVTPYSKDGSVVESQVVDFSYRWASGGFISTVEDLMRFGNAHIPTLNAGFLQKKTLQLMFKPEARPSFIPGSGLGWFVARDPHLRKVYFHFGAGSGTTTFFAVYPDAKVCLAILANLGHAKFTFEHLMGIANSFLDDPVKAPLLAMDFLIILLAGIFVFRKAIGRN